ncbi:MAG TPA: hypothetical protein PLR18_02800, partial [bacterium]|nr:hypothetical protein [bacterium]
MNTRRIKNIYFLAAFLLVAFFIININANTSLAADDDAVVPACIDDDCDNSQYYCVTAHSLDWTASGYPSGAGNPSCCGDDSQEYYKQHPNQSSWTGCCNTDIDPYSVGKCFADVGATCSDNNFYCDTNGRCVDDGSYFESGALRSIDGLYAADREYCFESASINTGYGIWYDQDRYSWTCQEGTWFSNSSSCKSAGPDGVCDDTGITSDGFCCGDDATASVGEYTSGCRSLGDQISANCSSDLICCPNDSCVYNNQCYPSIGKLYSVGVQPDLKTLCILAPTYAFGTAWVDCDQSGEVWSWPMGKVLVNQPNMCNTCGGSWAIGGESLVFGEYDSGTATECCGDDSGEYYITSFCPGYSGSGKCCNGAGKSIDASGNCVASCPVPNTAPTSFSLSSPANNATMVSTSPTLSWSESTDPEGTTVTYNIYYCCFPTAGCTLPSSPNYTTSGESWSLSGLTLGNYCRWNVVASDGSLQTTSSNGPFSFRVNQAPNTPV